MLAFWPAIFTFSLNAAEATNFLGGGSHYFGPGNTMPNYYGTEYRVPVKKNASQHTRDLDDAAYIHDTVYHNTRGMNRTKQNKLRMKADMKMVGDTFFVNPVVSGALMVSVFLRQTLRRQPWQRQASRLPWD